MRTLKLAAGLFASVAMPTVAMATDLEVTHWWTSGGEAAAVAELAKAFNAAGDNWVDGAIAGGGGTARPIMISRITGGDPMGATQFNHGQQALELVEAGLMLDLTDVAEANNWKEVVFPPSLLDACTVDGRIYCAPVNIHSPEWLWLSNKVYADLGLPVPTTWTEFVASADQVRAGGKVPLALGDQPWRSNLAFGALTIGVGGLDLWKKVNIDKDMTVAAGPEMAAVFQATADARALAVGSNVQDWNQATNLVITDMAGGQIMGDWAQGEFQWPLKWPVPINLPSGHGDERVHLDRGRRFHFPKNDADIEAATEAACRTAGLARGAGGLQPEEGFPSDPRRRRSRRCERLHEEGSRDPGRWKHRARRRHPVDARHRQAGRRPDGRILEIRSGPGGCPGQMGRYPVVQLTKVG